MAEILYFFSPQKNKKKEKKIFKCKIKKIENFFQIKKKE